METCPYCGAEIVYTAVRGISVRIPVPCQCFGAAAERARQDEEDERRAFEEAYREAMSKVGVPPVLNLHESWGDEGAYDYYLYGRQGRGKSEAAAGIVRRFVREGIHRLDRGVYHAFNTARFINVPDWLGMMRDTYGRRGASEEEVIARYAGVGLLVLDDIGKGKMTDWAVERIYRIVDNRYRNGRHTTFTSQYDLTRLVEYFAKGTDGEHASAIASRISGKCVQTLFDGPDWRVRRAGGNG